SSSQWRSRPQWCAATAGHRLAGTRPITPGSGWAGERLDELCGSPGVIDEIARTVLLDGKVKGAARRALTPALAIRLTLLMTLMPDADYAEVMAALLGDLPLVPWQRPYQVPTATVACTWREALGPRPLERLRDKVLAGIDAGHREHDWRAVLAGAPGGVLDRRVADPGARQRREPAGLRVGGHRGRLLTLPAAAGAALLAGLHPRHPGGGRRPVRCRRRRRPGQGRGRAGAAGQGSQGQPARVPPGRLRVMDRNYPGVL